MGFLKDVGKVAKGALGIIAPTIAGALPGPLGGIAKKAITDILGLAPEATEADIDKALEAHPELLVQVKQANLDFEIKMEELGISKEQIHQKDRSSARAREMALKDKTPAIMGFGIIAGWMTMTGTMMFRVMPDANHDLIMTSFGILSAAVVGVINYYYGSSTGSKEKTKLLNKGGL